MPASRGGAGSHDAYDGDGDDRQSSPSKMTAAQRGMQQANDGEVGDEEGVTVAEYNKWLYLEKNWESAEDTRQNYMEGSQFRKTQDERHRERGLERQAASIEQMKQAKTKVEQHRQANLASGKQVRDDVLMWRDAQFTRQHEWVEHGKKLKDRVANLDRQRAEKDALLDLKKKLSLQVKKQVEQLAREGKAYKEQVLDSNRSQASKVRSETANEVTDSARKMFFEQRQNAANETATKVKEWDAQRRANKLKFREDAAKRKEAMRKGESTARSSRKTLQEQKQKNADQIREHKKQAMDSYRYNQAERAALIKQMVNSSVEQKFASPEKSRRMLQHPHFQEVTAVVTDITSSISKEIAASPSRRRPLRLTNSARK